MEVPHFRTYFATRDAMEPSQLRYFDYWAGEWESGRALDVQGNISYLFAYAHEILATRDGATIVEELSHLHAAYQHVGGFEDALTPWISDGWVLLGDLVKALQILPLPPVGATGRGLANRSLTFKRHLGRPISAREVVAMVGPKVTTFGRRSIELVESQLQVELDALRSELGADLVGEWSTDAPKHECFVFSGSIFSTQVRLTEWSFSLNERAVAHATELIRTAENVVREDAGLPHVGEGWVSETELFYKLMKAFPTEKLEHHAQRSWLGRQHLDILFAEHGIAVEYQGRQHDEPVAFFGGEQAFRRTQSRDKAKRRKCAKAGVKLLEVRPDYDFDKLVETVRSILK